jgi:hypothetical protein
MKRTMRGLALLAGLVLAGAALAQDKVPSIKEIMARLNKPGGVYPAISKELKADSPDWSEVQQQAKSFVKMADALGKNPPPKGDLESWTRLTKEYADNARALDAAAAKKDHAAANAARTKLGNESCKACHKAHQKK